MACVSLAPKPLEGRLICTCSLAKRNAQPTTTATAPTTTRPGACGARVQLLAGCNPIGAPLVSIETRTGRALRAICDSSAPLCVLGAATELWAGGQVAQTLARMSAAQTRWLRPTAPNRWLTTGSGRAPLCSSPKGNLLRTDGTRPRLQQQQQQLFVCSSRHNHHRRRHRCRLRVCRCRHRRRGGGRLNRNLASAAHCCRRQVGASANKRPRTGARR